MFLLFDVDGTLTVPRNPIKKDFKDFLYSLREKDVTLGVVSGSDLSKLEEQIGKDILQLFHYVFSENGLVAYHNGHKFHSCNMVEYIGEKNYQEMINIFLKVLSKINLPLKRGNFLELRTGMLNVCPVGRSCSQKERDDFEMFDNANKIREEIVRESQRKLANKGITGIQMSIGGQISIDVFPKGWNKTYCLQFIKDTEKIHFFGDRIYQGGNDYEIGTDSRVIAHSVQGPDHTKEIIYQLLK